MRRIYKSRNLHYNILNKPVAKGVAAVNSCYKSPTCNLHIEINQLSRHAPRASHIDRGNKNYKNDNTIIS